MNKYYLQIVSYRDDNSISSIKIIGHGEKTRAENQTKKWKNLKHDFYLIPADFFRQLSCAGDLGEAQLKLVSLEIKNLLELKNKEDKNGEKNHQQS